MAVVVDLSSDAALELVAVEQRDLLRSNPIDAEVAEALVHDLRHVAIADDSFLFEVQLGVGVEELLDEFRELHAAALGNLTGLAFLLKENGLTLYLFLDLLGGHARFGSVGHGSAYLLAVHIVAAGYHDEVAAVSLVDGRHYITSKGWRVFVCWLYRHCYIPVHQPDYQVFSDNHAVEYNRLCVWIIGTFDRGQYPV